MYTNTTVTNTFEAVMEHLQGLDNSETVSMHNTYCQNTGDSDNEIYNNDEDFFETFYAGETMKALQSVHFGDWRYNDEYVQFNGYANLESFNNPSEYVDLAEIANDILENPSNYDIELEDEDSEETN